MRRETLEQIIAARKIEARDGAFAVPDGERATFLVGQDHLSAIPGIIRFALEAGYLAVESQKGTRTYIEYEAIKAVSFELKEVADRQAGFV